MPGAFSLKQYQELANAHGGFVGLTKVDPMTTETIGSAANPYTKQVLNKNPAYRYNFADNTYIILRADPQDIGPNGIPLSYNVEGGTALKDTSPNGLSPVSGANSSNPFIVQQDTSGNLVSQPNPNYAQEPTVPTGVDAEGNQTRAPLSEAQFQNSQQQQAWENAQKQAQFDWQKEQARIQNEMAQRRMSFDQARAAAADANAKINQDLERQRITIASRGNDIAVRGQDVSLRGQDLGFVNNLVNSGVNAVTSSLPFQIPEGGTQALNTAVNAIGKPLGVSLGINVAPQQFPYDPQQLAYDLANQALQGISPTAQANLGQGPGNGLPPLTLPARPGPA